MNYALRIILVSFCAKFDYHYFNEVAILIIVMPFVMPLLQKEMMVMEILLLTSRNQMIKLYILFIPNVAVAMILQKYLTVCLLQEKV